MTASGRVDALVAADETLEMLGIDQSYVIDPFAAIDRLGLALHITKLDNLLGAVVPEGNGGVLVTSQRSPAIQRYTAAHEIGHWILHSEQLQVDGEEEVLGRPSTEMEREAQLFAGYFLMPPTLLNQALAAYELTTSRIEPEHVYRLSRDLDVSYEAASRRLLAGRFIDRHQFHQIADFGRMAALRRASDGHRPEDGLADVWDATSADDVVNLVVEEHDEVIVNLIEQRTTGWRWQTADELAQRNGGSPVPRPRPVPPATTATSLPRRPGQTPHPDLLLAAAGPADQPEVAITDLDDGSPTARIVEDQYLAGGETESAAQRRRRRATRARFGGSSRSSIALDLADEPTIGGNGVRTVVVRTAAPGSWRLQLYYAQAYDPDDEPLLSYQLQLAVQPTPNTAFRRRQLRSDLDRRLPGDPADDAEFGVD